MSPEEARARGVEAGEAEARKAAHAWCDVWSVESAWDAPQGRAVVAACTVLGDSTPAALALLDAFRDGWREGLESALVVRRGVYPLRAGRDAGGLRFFVADVPVRTGGALVLALHDGTPLRGRLETKHHAGEQEPWFHVSVAGPSDSGDASFPVKPWHRFHPLKRAEN